MKKKDLGGFTFLELAIAGGIFSVTAAVLVTFLVISSRFISRNFATNHSHETTRTAAQRMLRDLHDSGSPFALLNCSGPNGTAFTPVASAVTADRDPMSEDYIGTRANGVRFRRVVGGPIKLSKGAAYTDTDLSFDFAVNGSIPYVPDVGDKLWLPLLSDSYIITAVISAPSISNPIGTVRLHKEVGFTLTAQPTDCTTGYFLRLSAYTVFNNELRFHPQFSGAQAANYFVVQRDVTSPRPFALMYPLANSPTTDGRGLRISLEAHDLKRSAQAIQDATATLHLIVPPRTFPTLLSASD
jgi:type II secretory pathway pseudopilin PulG